MNRSGTWRASLFLFALAVWPTWVVDVPPLQDLANHLATAVVQSHPLAYPELASNGFFKTNSAVFLFLHVVGGRLGLPLAAKLFVTLTVGVGAWIYPRAVARLAGAQKASTATLLLWPMVHNWFVAMGMVDYALAVPLALEVLIQLDAFRRTGAKPTAVMAGTWAVLVWYTHAFAVMVVALLAILECVAAGAPRELAPKWAAARRLFPPLLPALALTSWSAFAQISSETHAGSGEAFFQGVLPLLYGLWAEWLWSLTKWTAVSIVAAVTLAWFGVRRFRERVPFFSPLAFGVLGALYLTLPYHTHRWFYVSSRMLPFLWMACALRVPTSLPRWAARVLGAAAVLWSAGLGIEYVQIAGDWDVLRRAEVAIPEGSRLLPLVFDRKGPHGDNTWPMLHSWGLIVMDRHTSAPLVFAHSRSFPLTYTKEPPRRFHQLNLEVFPSRMASSKTYCEEIEREVVLDDCTARYVEAWKEFWADAAPRFDRVLMYHPGDEVRAAIPPALRIVYDQDGVVVLAHQAPE
ncbi:MAG TPA: hypothetical protein VLM85_06275 [Polyangiaceae bacterium]|nr:hypothetical protein [Polyangiaceae bacterium]